MQILKFNHDYKFYDSFETVKQLPNKVLRLEEGAFGSLYLKEVDDFQLPAKIYSNDKDFIEHVVTTYKASDKSVGILLKGKRGLGKSFTSKVICTKLDLPVILITKATNTGLFDFLNQIEQEHIIYIDEFEKLFPLNPKQNEDIEVKQEHFLSFLDGGNTSKVKRLFIITTNENVDQYLLNRPSRIRYLRDYTMISDEVIEEIVLDKLENEKFKEDLIENLIRDELNVDSLIEIINEINISNKPYSYFKSFFNYRVNSTSYSVFIVNEVGELELLSVTDIPDNYINGWKSKKLKANWSLDDDYYLRGFLQEDDKYYLHFNGEQEVEDENGGYKKIPTRFILKKEFSKIQMAI